MRETNKSQSRVCWCGGKLADSIHQDYLRCENCGTFVSKAEASGDRLKAFYTYDGYWHDYVQNYNYPNLEQRGDYLLNNRVPDWYELMKQYKSNVDYLLEIGCAEGSFLYYCKQMGIKHIVGVEVDARTCEYAKQKYELEHIYPGLYPEVELPYSRYDVIAGFDILEHFIDPVKTLNHIYENLKDDGVGIFQTPRYRNDGKGWIHFKPDEHLFLFDDTNIRLLFDRCGFDVVSVTKGSLEQDMNVVVKKKINVDTLKPKPVRLVTQSTELNTYEKKKIAIGLIEHFGDIVACEPVSRYVRSENPEAYIAWCVRKEYKELLVSNPYIDEVVTVECLTEWIALKELGVFDEVVDLHIDGRICPVCQVPLKKGVPFRVDGENYYKVGNLLSAFSKGAGLPALDGSPNVYIDELARNAVDEMHLPPDYVVIHAKTNEFDRDWNLNGWIDVVSYVHKTYKLPVIEVGNEGIVEKALPDLVKFIGKTSYIQTAEVIRRAKLFIGVDSGPAHLANAVRTKGVIILGEYRNFKMYIPYSGYYANSENALLVYSHDGPARNVRSKAVIKAVDTMLLNVRREERESETENRNVENRDAKIIAFYLPQFHPIPENDKWWGKGFTEWVNVAKGRPLFPGHYQPHVPADMGFYDLRLEAVLNEQAALASMYGIDGFCFWHYWFDGKLLLEKPLLNVLNNKLYSFPFCLAWANENWTRRWDGLENEVLMKQTYASDEDLAAHFNWLLPFFKDPRYITINRKPVFIVYRPTDIPNISNMTGLWELMAKQNGLEGVYFIAVDTSFNRLENYKANGFSGELLFQPQFSSLVDRLLKSRSWVSNDGKSIVIDYEDAVKVMEEENAEFLKKGDDQYVTILPGWDNASRRLGIQAFVLRKPSPIIYEKWLQKEIALSKSKNDPEKRIIFINAWNEWGEGAHLEPDQEYGRMFLEATARSKNITDEFHPPVNWLYPIEDERGLREIIAFAEASKELGRAHQAEYYYKWGIRVAGRIIASLKHFARQNNSMTRVAGILKQYIVLVSSLSRGLTSVSANRGVDYGKSEIAGKLSAAILDVDLQQVISEAEGLIESHDFEKAENILKKGLEIFPLNLDILNDLAVLNILQNRYNEAFELLKKIISIDPENPTARQNIQVVLEKLNKVYDDLKKRTLVEDSRNPSDEILKAEQFIQEKAYEQAELLLNNVISRYPFNLDALNDLSVIYIMQGKTDKALEKLKAVLEIDPDNEIAKENMKTIEEIIKSRVNGDNQKNESIQTEPFDEKDQLPPSDEIQRSMRIFQESAESVQVKKADEGNELTSIIIVTYNNLNYTKQCVASILKYTAEPYEIIFIDNDSRDGTRGYLKKLSTQMKNVKTIFNTDNKGFPYACNQGIVISAGKYVLLLNSDVIVTDGWLKGMIKRAESDGTIGIVGPMTNRISGYQIDLTARYSNQLELKKFAADYKKKNLNSWTEVRRVAGFCMLIKREVVDKIGGLDPLFGVGNCEDDDYCLRASKAGYRTVIARDVFIHHYSGGSFLANGKENYLNIIEKNSEIFREKWGVAPAEWWRDGKEPTRSAPLYISLQEMVTDGQDGAKDEVNSSVNQAYST
ncbi:MAG: glycoside hydrolase family 99-like domain-containing protein [Candidatus Kryptoniota bacterium]